MNKEKNMKHGIGYVLKLLRIAREMSSKELSIEMGVSQSYISEIESNKKKPSMEMLSKYSEALNVKKSTILYFNEMGEETGYKYKELLLNILEKMLQDEKNHNI